MTQEAKTEPEKVISKAQFGNLIVFITENGMYVKDPDGKISPIVPAEEHRAVEVENDWYIVAL